MSWFSNKVRIKDLKPGDHIYTWRRGYSYSHGIYEGDGKVIHLTRGPCCGRFCSSPSPSPSPSPSHLSEGPMLSSTLKEFLSGGELYHYEYGVNALFFLIKRSGTCTCASSDPPKDVLHRASFLFQYGFGDYDLSNNNYEDFALYCKIELLDLKGSMKTGTSGQITSFVALITTIFAYIIMPYRFLPSSFTGLSLMFCFFYCNIRLHFDTGSRVSNVLERVMVQEFEQLSKVKPIWARDTKWIERGTKWILILPISALIVWSWTPESIYLLWLRTFLLYIILSRLFFDYFRNHHFKISVYLIKNILALMVWYWTPENTVLQDIQAYLLHGFFIVLVLNPLINHGSKLWQYIVGIVFLFNCWYWTPGSTIPQWFRVFLVNVCFYESVADERNHYVKPLLFILNFIPAFIIWYFTPETTILVWLRLLLLYGLYALLIINPNVRWMLGNYVDDTICGVRNQRKVRPEG